MSLNLLHDLVKKAEIAIDQTDTIKKLESLRILFLGKNGYIQQQFKILRTISYQNKPKLGLIINKTKQEIHKLFIKQKKKLKSKFIDSLLKTETLDVTLPGYSSDLGTFHPITSTIKRIKVFFNYLGFAEINGPEIDNSYYNFDALNIPINHPSRNERDTFWFDSKHLLRTHTSGIQIRVMSESKLPIRIISIGRVYRKDYDKYHTPMFHQIEGVIIDSNLNFSNLKKILYDFLYNFFGKDITLRFRPAYFPFTEPSAEIDIMITQKKCNESCWLELLGCGVIHPVVLNNVGIDSNKFSGLAFGIGIERLAMLLYRISDIRVFFENDLEFLKQFP